uniref:Uncharacterized protein n=1 Tax=Arion vulgaris TaxID=1028688 RepID=A0A0B7B3A0_9EUPU
MARKGPLPQHAFYPVALQPRWHTKSFHYNLGGTQSFHYSLDDSDKAILLHNSLNDNDKDILSHYSLN